MFSNYQNLAKIIMGLLYTVVVVLGILLFLTPPAVFPDPASGFQVMHSMEMGGGFNMLVAPSQQDFSKNTATFLTWWSPGQYLVPYLFKLLFGLNTGQASAITITLCQLLGLAGYYTFFKKIGFTPFISALSLLFIACQQYFVAPYAFYSGGEILSFAFLGWFLYGCTAFKNPDWKLSIFVLLMGWIGFFCKSSVMWMYAAGLLFMWLRPLSKKSLWDWIKNGMWIGMPAAVALTTNYLFFLSRGENPANTIAGFKLSLKALAFPLASPLLSGFSADDIMNGLIYHTGRPIFDESWSIALLVSLAALSMFLLCQIILKVHSQDYKLLIMIFYAVAVVFFSYAYLRQMEISYEARHFRVIGLIVIPGTLYLISQLKSVYRAPFVIVWASITVLSIIYVATRYDFNKKCARGTSGIAQEFIDQMSLDKIMQIDREQHNATFVFVNKTTGLEIRHNRILSLDPIGDDLKIDLDAYQHLGHAGPLYIVLPDDYAGPKEKMILKSFPGYKGWYGAMLSDKYVLYEAK
jgi:hypothetical protein